ncbi:MAG: HlyD family efflux transporter periplasmic adaptor subunit, partial [Pseudomonadota bacterium]
MALQFRRRWVFWGGVAALVIVAMVFAFRPAPVLVDVAVIERGTLEVTVEDDGETRVKDVFTVSAPITGHMLRIDGKVGDKVVAGETVLAEMLPKAPEFLDVRSRREAEAEVKAAEAALVLANAERDKAQAELNFARAELKRAKELARKGNISKSSLDRAEMEANSRDAALSTSVANVKVRSFALETAKARLIDPGPIAAKSAGACCVSIRAPVSGRILHLIQESEQVVEAGTPLVEIGDPVDLEIKVDLLSSDAVNVKEGDRVIIEGWGGPKALIGRVRRVEPSGFTKVSALGIEEQRVNVIIDFVGDPGEREGLAHGYRVDAKIVVWSGADVLTVPLGALFRDGGKWAVFVVEEGTARLTRVEIGRNGGVAEVAGVSRDARGEVPQDQPGLSVGLYFERHVEGGHILAAGQGRDGRRAPLLGMGHSTEERENAAEHRSPARTCP